MYDPDVCPRCGKELRCLGGHSAHPSNWLCTDEAGCGWQAWNGKTNAERHPKEEPKAPFRREPRYVVFKLKDIEKYLTQGEKDSLMCIGEEIALARSDDGRPPFNAVVVEQDWPEFEMVWAAIEKRMTANSEITGATPAGGASGRAPG